MIHLVHSVLCYACCNDVAGDGKGAWYTRHTTSHTHGYCPLAKASLCMQVYRPLALQLGPLGAASVLYQASMTAPKWAVKLRVGVGTVLIWDLI